MSVITRTTIMLAAILLAGQFSSTGAVDGKHINGIAVSECTRNGDYNWETMAAEGVFGQITNWGKICKFSIRDGKSVSCDTIFGKSGTPSAGALASHPSITFDGRRVAFYRLGATVNYAANPPKGQLVGSLKDSGWISVCDTNGQNLRNLARVPGTRLEDCRLIDMGPKVECVSGDWVYYEKPPFTGEFWRVNINSPESTNKPICKMQRGSWCTENSWDCSSIGPWGIRRWSISKAGNRTCGQIFGCYPSSNEVANFPYANGWYRDPASFIGGRSGCNGSISAGGRYVSFYNGNHFQANISMISGANGPITDQIEPAGVSRSPSLGDLATWAGESRQLKWGNHMRWAGNSEKWILWAGLHYYDDANFVIETGGMDQVAMNWVDKAGMYISHNPYYDNCIVNRVWNWSCSKATICNLGGDLFVFGGPANSYEKVDGTWQYVAPVDPVSVQPQTQRFLAADFKTTIDNTGNIHIRWSSNGLFRLEIMALNGRTMIARDVQGDAIILPAGALRKGMYVVRVYDPTRSLDFLAQTKIAL